MTTLDYRAAAKGVPGKAFEDAWETPPGLALTAVSHRVIGTRYMATGFIFFLIAGFLALLIRAQLAFPDGMVLSEETYNQVFTMHGTLMMFIFAIPILEGFAVYLIPQLVGARDLVFPRLGAYGYFCYLFGGVMLLSSLFIGKAPDGGWFMYVPLSTSDYSPAINQDFWLIGVTFAEISSVTAAVEIIASILCSRAPGMSLMRMPIICWYFLVTAFMIAVGFPPLIMGSILLEAQRALGLPFFDPAAGGDPLLWQHLFWIFGHPEVYIIFLPAAGMVATILPTFVGRPLFGYGFVVAAVVSMAFLSFGLWVHHMFTTGLPDLSLAFFSGASMAVAIPTGIQIFCLIATLAQARPRLEPPMLFILGFFFVFVLGGMTGVMVAAAPFDWQAHDSYFIVAHMHYVLFGGMVFPLLAAAYYWMPQIVGRFLSKRLSHAVFWLIFLGFNIAFLPMHITGLRGMPRRVATYPEGLGWDMLNLISSAGSAMLALGFLLFTLDVVRVLFGGGWTAGRNPWNASTLEWLYPPVTPGYNFRVIPEIKSREPLWNQAELEHSPEPDSGFLPVHTDGRRETIGSDAMTGQPVQILRLPHPTWWPLLAALATGITFLSVLLGYYWNAVAGVTLTLLSFVGWGWEPSDSGVTRTIGRGIDLPVNVVSRHSHMWVAMIGTLVILATLFLSIVFAYLFLWTANDGFFAEAATPEMTWLVAAAVGIAIAATSATFADRQMQATEPDVRQQPPLTIGLAILVSGAAGTLAIIASLLSLSDIMPAASAYTATVWALVSFLAILLAVSVIWHALIVIRLLFGRIHRGAGLPFFLSATYLRAITVMALAGYALVAIGPEISGGSKLNHGKQPLQAQRLRDRARGPAIRLVDRCPSDHLEHAFSDRLHLDGAGLRRARADDG